MKFLPTQFVKRFKYLLVALPMVFALNNAYACKWYDVGCKAREARAAIERAAKEARERLEAAAAATRAAAERAAAAAKAEAEKQAAAARAEAERQAAAVKAEAERQAAAAKSAAEAAARATATAGNSVITDIAREGTQIAAKTRKTYETASKTTTSFYNQNVGPYLAAIFSKDGLFKLAGQLFLGQHGAWIREFQSNLRNVDKAALNRVVGAITDGRLDEQTRADMVALSRMIPRSGVPGNVTNSSFGVQVCATAALVVGASECYIMMIDVVPTNGKNNMALAMSVGGSLGVSAGAAVSTGFFWAPANIAESTGASVGFGVEGGAGAGGGLGLSWGVSKGMEGADKAIPGIALDVLVPAAKVDASFQGGWTQVITRL